MPRKGTPPPMHMRPMYEADPYEMVIDGQRIKTVRKVHHQHYIPKDAKIIVLKNENTFAPGTHRYRNRDILLDCKNVAEARGRLKEVTPPGGRRDIVLALENGVIALE